MKLTEITEKHLNHRRNKIQKELKESSEIKVIFLFLLLRSSVPLFFLLLYQSKSESKTHENMCLLGKLILDIICNA